MRIRPFLRYNFGNSIRVIRDLCVSKGPGCVVSMFNTNLILDIAFAVDFLTNFVGSIGVGWTLLRGYEET